MIALTGRIGSLCAPVRKHGCWMLDIRKVKIPEISSELTARYSAGQDRSPSCTTQTTPGETPS